MIIAVGEFSPVENRKREDMGMCEYCKESKTIISSIKQFEDRIETVVGGIQGNKLKVSTIIQTAIQIPPPAFSETEIKYCPMCGRKLD